MLDELKNMCTGTSKSYNIFQINQYSVKRVTPYTWELYLVTMFKGTEVYQASYGYKELDKLVMYIKRGVKCVG